MDEKLILGTNFKFHHSALCRGYVRINEGYAENYSGRFGIGKKIHHPNRLVSSGSNNYHVIEYWIAG